MLRIFPEVHTIFQIPQSIKSFSGFFIKDEVIPLILPIQFIPVIQLILVIQANSVNPLILVIQVTLVTPVIPVTPVRFRFRLQNLRSGFQNLNLEFPLKCNPSLTCHSCHLTIMNKSLGTLLHFWGVFQFTQVQLLPSPHKQGWTGKFFRVSTLYTVGVGEGGLQENFKKDALFY